MCSPSNCTPRSCIESLYVHRRAVGERVQQLEQAMLDLSRVLAGMAAGQAGMAGGHGHQQLTQWRSTQAPPLLALFGRRGTPDLADQPVLPAYSSVKISLLTQLGPSGLTNLLLTPGWPG